MPETLTFSDAGEGSRQATGDGNRLILALESGRPLALPASHGLALVDEVVVGRGPERSAKVAGHRLRVEVADPWMSSQHARLERVGPGWRLSDLGSKNGTLVNGRRVEEATVGADDLLEIGGSFFLLRSGPGGFDPEVRPAFRTLCRPLAEELEVLERIARAAVPVLLGGETGTGKEVLARALHAESGRRGSFVAVNCGAIPATLVESELFGVKKGAFSGAVADRPGLIRAAHKGTLFLDEIAELPEPAQASLLRVLQEGEVRPLGETDAHKVDLRVIAASHEDLAADVEEGRFRRDLYARLKGYRFTLPPLRDRREDLGLLVAELLPRIAGSRAPRLTMTRAAARALLSYDWPLNIRELEQALRVAVAVTETDEIDLGQLPPELRERSTPPSPGSRERERFVGLIRRHRGNVSAVARELGTSRSQVRRLAGRFGVDLVAGRDGGAGSE